MSEAGCISLFAGPVGIIAWVAVSLLIGAVYGVRHARKRSEVAVTATNRVAMGLTALAAVVAAAYIAANPDVRCDNAYAIALVVMAPGIAASLVATLFVTRTR